MLYYSATQRRPQEIVEETHLLFVELHEIDLVAGHGGSHL
jgi:hypothetical protein